MRELGQKTNDLHRMQAWAGQAAALAREEPAGDFARRLWKDAEDLLPPAFRAENRRRAPSVDASVALRLKRVGILDRRVQVRARPDALNGFLKRPAPVVEKASTCMALGQCEPLDTRPTLESSIWFDPPTRMEGGQGHREDDDSHDRTNEDICLSHPSKSRGFVRYSRKRSCVMTPSQPCRRSLFPSDKRVC